MSNRILGVSVKPKEMSDELLVVLGSRDKQWSVLEKVTVRNQQNGLVSFELTESFDRFVPRRLLESIKRPSTILAAFFLRNQMCDVIFI